MKCLRHNLICVMLLMPLGCWGGLNISPLRTEISGRPGQTLQGVLSLSHQDASVKMYEVTVDGLAQEPSTNVPWLQIQQERIEVGPETAVEVPYVIHIPAAAKGELLGRIGFADAAPAAQSPVAIRTKISVPIHVLIKGTEICRAAIKEIRIASASPLNMEVDVENQGNILLRPEGECRVVESSTGREVAVIPVNQVHTPLYTGVTRTFSMPSGVVLPPGNYEALVQVRMPPNPLMLEQKKTIQVPEIRN
ncbi:MAG: hypothetical protein V2A34_13675 [Lentisphaerota bacterium]